MSLTINYYYSACVKISSCDVSVLCDPWFTDGIYDGSWFKEINISDPVSRIGDVDYIFISHIHPDHYDPIFLSSYMDTYGQKKILIASRQYNYLKNKLLADGFSPIVVNSSSPFSILSSKIHILPIKPECQSSIDSILVFEYSDTLRTHTVVNTNDALYEDIDIAALKMICTSPDILLCGYTGAGPYPQTYFDVLDDSLLVAAHEKKETFFQRYLSLTKSVQASVNIPFAGQYLLGGSLSHLNQYRGISDPTEVLHLDPNAVVLDEMIGSINTQSKIPINPRKQPLDCNLISQRINEIKSISFPYHNLFNNFSPSLKQLLPLLRASYRSALKKSTVDYDYYLAIAIPDGFFVMNLRRDIHYCTYVNSLEQVPIPRSIYTLDLNYLFGLLTHVYHWNNAEIGSHITVRRQPNTFRRPVQHFLHFLHV